MTKRELINHLESLDVPDDAIVLIEAVYDYGDTTEWVEWDLPEATKNEFQHPVIIFGDASSYNRGVNSTVDYHSRKFRPETESEAAIRLKREERENARRLAHARMSGSVSIIQAYQGDVTRRITEKVFASYLRP